MEALEGKGLAQLWSRRKGDGWGGTGCDEVDRWSWKACLLWKGWKRKRKFGWCQ